MNCLIVDDDPLTLTLMSEYAKRTEFIKRVATCPDPVEAINMLEQEDFELLLLDIEMPGMSGLEMLKAISEPPATVLITSRVDYALEAYESGVIDYLVKPVKYNRFFVAVKKAMDYRLSLKGDLHADDSVFIKVSNQFLKIRLNDILYIEALADYVILHMACQQQHIVLTTMKGIALRLPDNFLRIHRSYIVNYNHIEAIEDSSVLIQKKYLAVSNTYKANLLSHLKML